MVQESVQCKKIVSEKKSVLSLPSTVPFTLTLQPTTFLIYPFLFILLEFLNANINIYE